MIKQEDAAKWVGQTFRFTSEDRTEGGMLAELIGFDGHGADGLHAYFLFEDGHRDDWKTPAIFEHTGSIWCDLAADAVDVLLEAVDI